MLTRRLFLGAALAAPAIVRSESPMKLWVPPEPRWVGFDLALRGDMTVVVRGDAWLREALDPSPDRPWGVSAVDWLQHQGHQSAFNKHLREALGGFPRLAVCAPEVGSFCASPHK
jgi:hypothetical protein